MKTVLIYSRPAWRSFWWDVARHAFKGHNLVGLSEFKGVGDINLMTRFYSLWPQYGNSGDFNCPALPMEEVRLRCRLLNKLPQSLAYQMISCAWQSINEILEDVSPDYVLSITVDSYIIDLIARAARLKDIKFIGISNCPIPGYSLVSERGEHNKTREPALLEVEGIKNIIVNTNFKPKYMIGDRVYSIIDHLKRVAYFKIKNTINKIKLLSDPYNYNLMVVPFASDRKRIGDCLINRYFDRNPLVSWGQTTLPKLYIPLHFVPEATVNYWTQNLDFIEYETALLQVAHLMSDKFSIVVKEHPAAIGTRDPSFYKRLKGIKNLTLVHADFHSISLIEGCDVVLTWTGTVGFEAALRHRQVLVLGDPYYYTSENYTKIRNFIEISEFCYVENSKAKSLKEGDLISHVLSGTLHGAFGQKGYMSEQNAERLGASLKCFVAELSS